MVDKWIAGINVMADCSNLSALPDLTIGIDGSAFVLHPKEYVLTTQDKKGKTTCTMGVKAGADQGHIILGDLFMRKYPTLFDLDHNTVSFLKHKKAVDQVSALY